MGELTLVFDAGQNSADNVELVEGSPLHFVGSLPPSDHPELLAVPTSRYKPVDAGRFPGLSAFETTKVVFGVERRIVVTHSENLHDKQSRGFDQTLAKARRQLAELASRLGRGNTRKSRQKVEAEIEAILKPRWLSRVISTTLVGETPAELRLTWRTKPKGRQVLEDELFGKRILFTDKDRAPRAEIVADYRSQSDVEADFRQMKDPHVVSFSPDVPLDRPQDPGPRLVLRARPHRGPPHGARSRPPPDAHERARAARHPRWHPRDRAALPRRTGPPPSPAHAHRDRPHPTTPLRHLRSRRLRPRQTVTTPAPLPAAWTALEAALRQRCPVSVSYHGRQRLVCPHALGWKNNRPMLLAYQNGGQTSTGVLNADPRKQWRCMFVDDIDDVVAAEPAIWATADNYNASHPFNAIDEVTIAITSADPLQAS